ncbi:hypothetical protein GCM10023081_01790 [Arthrobacter ginkgonis]|uniref:Uncharacterized protein n=1 Tax=Arthrobacter ginkgonis TaxID=1630594 RepID=A0ABP7BPF3_9MICC
MENVPASTDDAAARQSLEQLSRDRARASSAARAPWWYHAVVSIALAAFILAFGLQGGAFTAAISLSATVAVLAWVLRPRVTKTQADPWSEPANLRTGLTQTLAALIVGGAGVAIHAATGLGWVLWTAAALAAALYFLLATRMESALAASIRAGKK